MENDVLFTMIVRDALYGGAFGFLVWSKNMDDAYINARMHVALHNIKHPSRPWELQRVVYGNVYDRR